MDIFSSFSSGFEQILISVLGFVLMMSIVIFIHEFGHYGVARLCGVKVTDFSIGFGKKILSKRDKNGTLWSVSLIPMGGYVKFFGDRSVASDEDIEALNSLSEEDKKQTFYFKSIPQKMAVILAGPLANILLCFFLLFGLSFFLGINDLKPAIETVVKDSAADRNGLKNGDFFLQVNGEDITKASQVRKAVSASFGEPLQFKILRNNQEIFLSFAPDMISAGGQPMPRLGVIFNNAPENIVSYQYDYAVSAKEAYNNTVFFVETTVKFFQRLFTGKADRRNISGPIRIGEVAGNALQSSIPIFILTMALISMSVGIVNLLPVPMLDGGHLLFYMFELVGFKANSSVREIAFKAGFVLVICVMIFTVVNDIMILGTQE